MGERSGTRLFGPRGGAGNATKLETMLGRDSRNPRWCDYLSARGQQMFKEKPASVSWRAVSV
jgi:hypothetical protein